jgi:hypothetical protein
MIAVRPALAFSLLLAGVPGILPAQEETTLYEYQRRTEVVAHNIVNLVRPHLTAAEARIVAETSIRVEPTWLTNAYARRASNGARQIVFGAGLSAYLEQIADAYVTEDTGRRECTKDYVGYVAPLLVENTHREQRGLAPQGVALFYTFARSTRGACRGASPEIFRDPDTGRFFAGIMDASVAFVVLHELGHQVLGHVDSRSDDLAADRANESHADAWAVSTAFRSGYDLRSAIPWFFLTAAIGGETIEDERHSDHPLGGRRVLDTLKQARQILSTSDPKSAGLLDETIRELEQKIPN